MLELPPPTKFYMVYICIYFSEECSVIIRFCVLKFSVLQCYALLVSHVFLLSFSDEKKVGPWPRGPIFPVRKKAL